MGIKSLLSKLKNPKNPYDVDLKAIREVLEKIIEAIDKLEKAKGKVEKVTKKKSK